jgi:hypothetical protein
MAFLDYEKPRRKPFPPGQRIAFFLIHLICVFVGIAGPGSWYSNAFGNGHGPDDSLLFLYAIGGFITSAIVWVFLKRQKFCSSKRLAFISLFTVGLGLSAFLVGIGFYFLLTGLAYIYSPP